MGDQGNRTPVDGLLEAGTDKVKETLEESPEGLSAGWRAILESTLILEHGFQDTSNRLSSPLADVPGTEGHSHADRRTADILLGDA